MYQRPRRNRKNPAIRAMIAETSLRVEHLVQPLFVVDGEGIHQRIPSLPVAARMSYDYVRAEVKQCVDMGIKQFIMFPAVDESLKDPIGSYGLDPNNFYLQIARKLKAEFPEIVLISDVALDPYSSDGHDGLVRDGKIVNDETLEILAQMAVVQAGAGFDMIGPSDMMDGRVEAIREALDEYGFTDTSIVSYCAKYASAFYGPFRDALDSAPKSGDKKTYQMDPANKREALLEMELDTQEGADFLMVKPAIHYLDVIQLLSEHSHLPIAAYHVSGECALIIAASEKGWVKYDTAVWEAVQSIKRAGASMIITYFAKDIARMLQK